MLVEHFEILVWARRDSSPFGINSAGLDQTSAQLLENIRGWLEPQRKGRRRIEFLHHDLTTSSRRRSSLPTTGQSSHNA